MNKKTNTPLIDPTTNTCLTEDHKTIYDCYIDDKGNIRGITEDHKKALFLSNEGKWLFGKEIRINNLISLSDRTKEERMEIVKKSHEKQKENREAKKTFNELARALLEIEAPEKEIREVLGDDRGSMIDNTYASLILSAMVKGAKEGSFKCAEFIRDTAGYKPKNEVELQADIMTEADKSLIDKALKTG